ncbi:MAG TPA: hypothetical protein VHF25_08455 [Nitriliruptorales bacterium]|nr:hypothetical protein [Nitriliruptorales bacterium]
MNLLALATEFQTFWWVALGMGLVVVIVVIALLTLLLRIVQGIDTGVREVWETATRLASNTATTLQLHETGAALKELREEAQRHDELLGSKL